MKTIFYILLNLIFFGSLMAQNKEFKKVIDTHISNTVPIISVDSLKKDISKYIILDAREYSEFRVSHLKNAIWVGYDSFDLSETLKKIDKKQPIVIYCSIGYRSEKIGEQLQKQGCRAYNLYGGIFQWANSGFQVVDNYNQVTKNVHGYDLNWGKWLTNSEVVYGK